MTKAAEIVLYRSENYLEKIPEPLWEAIYNLGRLRIRAELACNKEQCSTVAANPLQDLALNLLSKHLYIEPKLEDRKPLNKREVEALLTFAKLSTIESLFWRSKITLKTLSNNALLIRYTAYASSQEPKVAITMLTNDVDTRQLDQLIEKLEARKHQLRKELRKLNEDLEKVMLELRKLLQATH